MLGGTSQQGKLSLDFRAGQVIRELLLATCERQVGTIVAGLTRRGSGA